MKPEPAGQLLDRIFAAGFPGECPLPSLFDHMNPADILEFCENVFGAEFAQLLAKRPEFTVH